MKNITVLVVESAERTEREINYIVNTISLSDKDKREKVRKLCKELVEHIQADMREIHEDCKLK